MKFPFDKKIFENRRFVKEVFADALKDILTSKGKYSGFIRINKTGNLQYLLFFLKGRCYAAGLISKSRPISISIKELFKQVSSISENQLSISLYEIDPILLKGILVFIQREPTVKAETNLIDLESILGKIEKDGINAFVILKGKDMMNFFFFKAGKAIISYFADIDFEADKTASVSENLLFYAYPADKTVVEAFIYRNIKTSPAEDSESIDMEDIIKMIYDAENEKVLARTDEEKQKLYLELFVIEGQQAGENFNVALPCVIGRKGSDVTIKDSKVSRRHAGIREIAGQIIIEDLKSTNGTVVNNEKIKVKELQSGDVILVGDTKMRVSFYWGTSGDRKYTP